MVTDEINRREHSRLTALLKLSHARQKQLATQLAELDRLIDEHIAGDASLAAKACG